MAYLAKDGKEPLANLAGEWLSNYCPLEAGWRKDPWIRTHRIGRPRTLGFGTILQGVVGVYLTRDLPLPDGATEIPTPEQLKEPAAGEGG